jgi:hypothetical protein
MLINALVTMGLIGFGLMLFGAYTLINNIRLAVRTI